MTDEPHIPLSMAHKMVLDERERLAKIVDDYCDWTHWGEVGNGVVAEQAAAELAQAIRLGRALTTEEIRAVDAAHKARILAQQQNAR